MFKTLRSKVRVLALAAIMVSVPVGLANPAGAVGGPNITVTTTVSRNGGVLYSSSIAAYPGDSIIYRVTVTNTGTASATAVQFTDTVEPYATYLPGRGKFAGNASTIYSAATALTEGAQGYDYTPSNRTVTFKPPAPISTITPGSVIVLFFQATQSQAANIVTVNAATVNFTDAASTTYPPVTGTATITGLLVFSAPAISSPADQTVVQGGTAHLTYTISGQTDGPDTYNLSVASTPSNTTSVLPTFPGGSSITLGGTRLAAGANAGNTSIIAQGDGNASNASLNGLTPGAVIRVASIPYIIAAGGISKDATQNTATITLTTPLTTTATAADVVGEQKTVQVDVPSGTVTSGSAGTQTVTLNATSTSDTTQTSNQGTATVITVNQPTNQIAVTVTGAQTYGSSGPSFTPSYTAPVGITVGGSVNCTNVNGGTAISSTLTAAVSYTIDPLSCSGLTAPGYTFAYTGASFIVTPATLTVTASSATVTYGDAVPVISPSTAASSARTARAVCQ